MIIQRFTPQNTALSLLQSAGPSSVQPPKTAAQKKISQEDTILASLDKTDPDKAKAFRAEQEQLRQTIEQLQASKSKASSDRKEAARQKIQQIKAQIQALRLMAATDPKAAARQAAHLARELASAAKEYANAGGGSDAAASTSTASATSAAATSTTTAVSSAAPPADAGGTDGAAAPPAAAAAPSATGQPPVTPDASANTPAGTKGSDSKQTEAQTAASAADQAKKDREALLNTINEKIAEMNKKAGEADADSKFAAEVRHLMNQLKIVLKAAKEKLEDEGKSGSNPDITAAEKAFRDIEKSLGEISSGASSAAVTATLPGGTDLGAGAASATSVAINILA